MPLVCPLDSRLVVGVSSRMTAALLPPNPAFPCQSSDALSMWLSQGRALTEIGHADSLWRNIRRPGRHFLDYLRSVIPFGQFRRPAMPSARVVDITPLASPCRRCSY